MGRVHVDLEVCHTLGVTQAHPLRWIFYSLSSLIPTFNVYIFLNVIGVLNLLNGNSLTFVNFQTSSYQLSQLFANIRSNLTVFYVLRQTLFEDLFRRAV